LLIYSLLAQLRAFREVMAKYDARPRSFSACEACGVAHHEQLPCASMVAPHEAAGKVRRGKATKSERSKYNGVEWSSDDEKWRATLKIAIHVASSCSAQGDAGGEDAIVATVWLGLYEKETVAAGVHDIAARMQYGRGGLAACDARASSDAIGVLNFTAKSLGRDAKRKREIDKTLWTCCDECGKWRASTREVHNNVRRLNNAVKFTCAVIGRFCAEAQDVDVVAAADSDSDDELDGAELARTTLRAAAAAAGAAAGAAVGAAPDAAAQRVGAESAVAAISTPPPVVQLAASSDAAALTRATLLREDEAVRPRRPRDVRWPRSGQRALDVQNLRIAGRLPRASRRAPRAARSAAPLHVIRAVLKCDVPELKRLDDQVRCSFLLFASILFFAHLFFCLRLDDQMCRTLSQYAKPPVVAYGLQWFMLHCAPDRVKYRNWETLAAVPVGSASLRETPPLSLPQHAARAVEAAAALGAGRSSVIEGEEVAAEGGAGMESEGIGGAATPTSMASTPPLPTPLAAATTDAVGFVVFCLCVSTNGSSDPEAQAKAAAANPLLLKHAWLEIFWIMVDSSARRQGVGKRLIDAAMARARVRWPQVEEVRLHVLTQNRSAVRFYAKELNFVILDRKPYYSCYSAYRMHRPIDDAAAAAVAQLKRDAAAACIVGRYVAHGAYAAAVEAAVVANEAFEAAKRVLNERQRKEREALAAAERRRLVRPTRSFTRVPPLLTVVQMSSEALSRRTLSRRHFASSCSPSHHRCRRRRPRAPTIVSFPAPRKARARAAAARTRRSARAQAPRCCARRRRCRMERRGRGGGVCGASGGRCDERVSRRRTASLPLRYSAPRHLASGGGRRGGRRANRVRPRMERALGAE
jgi:ribosomal protein S18 acetylase RimI-like enzyme